VLAELPAESVDCCVTSPPYWGLRDYGTDGQIGLEASPEAFVAEMVAVFRQVRRVLAPHGTLWLNLGDSTRAEVSPDASVQAQHRRRRTGASHTAI
jgi:DNA modification methylase